MDDLWIMRASVFYFELERFMSAVIRCLLLLVSLFVLPASALTLGDVRVPLSNRATANVIAAEKLALGQLLVQLTGRRDVESLPGVQGILANPQKWLSQYGFESLPNNGQLLVAHFDVQALSNALMAAGAPVWPLSRPALLLWLVTPSGIANEALAPGLLQAAATRGLPLKLPVGGDAVSAADIRGRFLQPVWDASHGYGTDLVAMAIVYPGSPVRVRWWLYQKTVELAQGEESGADMATVQNLLVDKLTDIVVARYAVTSGAGGQFEVVVDAVPDLSAWRDLDLFLRGLAGVTHVNVMEVAGARVRWSLEFSGAADQLRRLLLVNRHVAACDQPHMEEAADAKVPLNFCWQP